MQQLVAQIDEFNIIKALKRRFCLIWIDKAPFFCLKRKIFDLSKRYGKTQDRFEFLWYRCVVER